MKKLAVVAIGGNAVNRSGEEPTAENMFRNLSETARYLVEMLDDYRVVITHGNGPQVGNLLVQQDLAKDVIPPFPLDVNDAQTQGSLGYMISQTLYNALMDLGKKHDVVTVITQIIVDKNDPAFENPTKPVGPFYDRETALKLAKEKGWKVVEDSGRGWRRVVPSPKPLDIVEKDVIRKLIDDGITVIAAGGGGIPVVLENGKLKGVEAVIDKDRASALLAKKIDADLFLILTSVERVYLNFNKPNPTPLDELKVEQAKLYLSQGHFPKGSMGPKIESAVDFVGSTGRECIITDLSKLKEALDGRTGTRIIP